MHIMIKLPTSGSALNNNFLVYLNANFMLVAFFRYNLAVKSTERYEIVLFASKHR